MEQSIEAQVVDSLLLKLKKPIFLAPGSTIFISVQSTEGVSEEQAWYQFSSSNLEIAYGADEPDYTPDMIKVANPEYQL
jgi:hypothetical protein